MEETKIVDTNTKTQLSLAAALFFSPLVHYKLNKNTRNISKQDTNFIRGYIRLGYIHLLFGLITIATGIGNYLFAVDILNVVYTISVSILILLLVISVVSILSDVSILQGRDHTLQTYSIEGNHKDIILKYLPIYNIFLWYRLHNFERPNWWIKESILLWISFLLINILGNVFVSSALLILIIFRVAALMSDIDLISISMKHRLNTLFFKNPEEIMGYLTGTCIYLGKSIAQTFTHTQPYTLAGEIAKEKKAYSAIIDITQNINIIIEYILGIIVTILLLYIIMPNMSTRTFYAGFGLIILRYLVMAIDLKHLPHLPIARELLLLAYSIIEPIKQRFFIHK